MNLQRASAAGVKLGTEATSHCAMAAAWLNELSAQAEAGQIAEKTFTTYRANLRPWIRFIERHAITVPTPAHVLQYIAEARATGKPATVNAHLAAVRALYRWAESNNLYPAIARSIKGQRCAKDSPLDCLAPEQVAGLVDAIAGDDLQACRARALINLLFATGLRLVSVQAINVGDVDLIEGAITYATKGGQGDKAQRVYIGPTALEALRQYLARSRKSGYSIEPAAPLFISYANGSTGRRLTDRSLRRVVVAAMELAGHVKRDKAGAITRPRIYSAHSLRRSAVTAAYDAQGLDAAQTLAGHASPATTRRAYARVKRAEVLRGLAVALDLGAIKQNAKGVAQ